MSSGKGSFLRALDIAAFFCMRISSFGLWTHDDNNLSVVQVQHVLDLQNVHHISHKYKVQPLTVSKILPAWGGHSSRHFQRENL